MRRNYFNKHAAKYTATVVERTWNERVAHFPSEGMVLQTEA